MFFIAFSGLKCYMRIPSYIVCLRFIPVQLVNRVRSHLSSIFGISELLKPYWSSKKLMMALRSATSRLLFNATRMTGRRNMSEMAFTLAAPNAVHYESVSVKQVWLSNYQINMAHTNNNTEILEFNLFIA